MRYTPTLASPILGLEFPGEWATCVVMGLALKCPGPKDCLLFLKKRCNYQSMVGGTNSSFSRPKIYSSITFYDAFLNIMACAVLTFPSLLRPCTGLSFVPSSRRIRAAVSVWNRASVLWSNSMSQPAAVSVSDTNSISSQNDTPPPENADVLVQYVVLRRDLIDTWPLGSVVTQGCHASVSAIWLNKDDPHTVDYCSPESIDSMHKVTLEVKGEPQILNLSEKLKSGAIIHKLWIEQPENIPTCLATKPYPKSLVSLYFKKLKLCK